MKKFFLFFAAVALATLPIQAEVYYLLPGSGSVNSPVGDINTYLPEEEGISPERRAFAYCKDVINGGTAKYVTIKDVTDGRLVVGGKPAMSTLWVNVDRVGLALDAFDAMFNNNVASALGNYVKAGGNLYLTKQATRLVTKIGRTDWWPSDYKSDGYADGSDVWSMTIDFCTEGNVLNHHIIYKHMQNGQETEDRGHITIYPLTSGSGSYRRTDNNCAWGDWSAYGITAGGCDSLRRSTFESHINGKVLGGWGHTRGLDYAGLIEFYPQGDFKGTVMAMGLAAYQWGAQNTSEYNVKNLTKGILEYLEGDAYWLDGYAPHNGNVGDSYTCTPLSHFEKYHIDLVSTDETVASFGEHGLLTLHAAGTTTIQAIYVGDGVESCKTQIILQQEITVTDPCSSCFQITIH